MSHHHHHRSLSRTSRTSISSATNRRSPSPSSRPSQTFHASILPRSMPTPALVESVAGGAHYAGIKVDAEFPKHPHTSMDRRRSSQEMAINLKADHHRVMADLQELYCCRPTPEIFERSWNKEAVFEVMTIHTRFCTFSHVIHLSGPAFCLQRIPRICCAGTLCSILLVFLKDDTY